MPRPTDFYIRQGETDWNVGGRLQGRHDVPLNARGREQARHCGIVLRDLFAREDRDAHGLNYVASPLVRASETMRLAREAMGLDPQAYRTDERLTEIAFGDWEGCTLLQLRFLPPIGESYEMVSLRMRAWYEALDRDVVAVAHGGTGRGLMAVLGVAKPAAAPLVDVAQGVVYVFSGDKLTRYA